MSNKSNVPDETFMEDMDRIYQKILGMVMDEIDRGGTLDMQNVLRASAIVASACTSYVQHLTKVIESRGGTVDFYHLKTEVKA